MESTEPTPSPGNDAIPFTPVPRSGRRDGWTPERQRAFIAALAETGNVRRAAARLGMSPTSAYNLRDAPGAEEFVAAWRAAVERGTDRLEDIALQRAIEGVAVPIMFQGEQVGERRWYNDRLLMFMLRGRRPDRYGGVTAVQAAVDREADDEAADRARAAARAKASADLLAHVDALVEEVARNVAVDPIRRKAFDLLFGPTDWTAYDPGEGPKAFVPLREFARQLLGDNPALDGPEWDEPDPFAEFEAREDGDAPPSA